MLLVLITLSFFAVLSSVHAPGFQSAHTFNVVPEDVPGDVHEPGPSLGRVPGGAGHPQPGRVAPLLELPVALVLVHRGLQRLEPVAVGSGGGLPVVLRKQVSRIQEDFFKNFGKRESFSCQLQYYC